MSSSHTFHRKLSPTSGEPVGGGSTTIIDSGDIRPVSPALAAEIAQLHEQLDARPKPAAAAVRPRSQSERRFAYRTSGLAATMEHPSGGGVRLQAHARELSCSELTFLHKSFLYAGSTCTVQLPRKDGQLVPATGSITTCQHVRGVWHESTVKFLKRVDPLVFVNQGAPGSTAGDANGGDENDLSALAGRVLYVDDVAMESRLVTHYLRTSRVDLVHASSAQQAIEAITRESFDVLLCDLNLDGSDGLDVVRKARDGGFLGPIVIVSAETRGDRLADCKAAGVDAILAKPYTRKAFVQLMVQLHEKAGALIRDEAIYSSIDEDPESQALLAAYVTDVKSMAERLHTALAAGELTKARELCLNMKGSAAAHGFLPLQLAAEAAVRSLDATMSIEESRPHLRSVELICSRICVRENMEDAAGKGSQASATAGSSAAGAAGRGQEQFV